MPRPSTKVGLDPTVKALGVLTAITTCSGTPRSTGKLG